LITIAGGTTFKKENPSWPCSNESQLYSAANVNDLIEKAEDPEKMLKQLLLDMENQLLQVKTQVAITIADQHLLEKKKKEHDDAAESWQRKAELAVNKGQDDPRPELHSTVASHTISYRKGLHSRLKTSVLRQRSCVPTTASCSQKLKETEARCELLIAQQRRARAIGKASKASTLADGSSHQPFHRPYASEDPWE